MIIQCPACATRYVVPDTAIGAEGRTVRCAKCRHSWFQDGPDLSATPAPAPQVAPPPPPAPVAAPPAPAVEQPVAPPFAPAGPAPVTPEPEPEPEPGPGPDPELSVITPPMIDRIRPPSREDEDDGPSPFDAQPPFRPRRNWLKIWTFAAAIFAVFAAAIIFAVSYWGLPDWVPVTRPDFAASQPDLEIDFPAEQQAKREMRGREYFEVNGTITNIGSTTRSVPPILVVLRDARDRKVFELEIVPEQSRLGPGESINVTRAVLDVPRSARVAEIGWKPQ